MKLIIDSLAVPLTETEENIWRVSRSRVLFSLVVEAFNQGHTAESIVQNYDTLQLADVYTVIAFYLNNKENVDAFLETQNDEADAVWESIRSNPAYQTTRDRLLNRQKSLHHEVPS